MSGKVLGYIGVGDMGGPMARNLLKAGFDVVVYDTQQDRLESLAEAGARAASSAREVADRAEIVMVCLNTIEAGHAVAKEVAGGKAVRIYVDMSTTGPSVAADIRAHFDGTEIVMLDAPVSGHISKAVDGSLTVIVSGSREAAEQVRPAFEAMGENIFYIGDIAGGGQMMKLANNYLNNVQAIATSEAITMGIKFGLDPKIMFDVLNVSTGRNSQTSGKLRDAVLSREFAGGANMKISHKDISLAVEEAESLGSPALTGALVRGIFAEALAKGGDKERSSAIFKYVAAKAGLDFGGG
jgi:3-hydroxyisobutyrate dehydrogenase-like beta-hydroxyacid dehydrogenase